MYKCRKREILNALMVGKMQSLFPSTRSLIIKDSKCPHGQAVKTSPSHGGIWGSIPHGGTKKKNKSSDLFFSFHGELHTACAWLCHTNPRTLGWRFAI